MTVDMKKLKAGDTVKFRCDGEAVVSLVSSDGIFYEVHVSPNLPQCFIQYRSDGKIWGNNPKENHGLAFDLTGIDRVSSYKITINKADPHDCKIELVEE